MIKVTLMVHLKCKWWCETNSLPMLYEFGLTVWSPRACCLWQKMPNISWQRLSIHLTLRVIEWLHIFIFVPLKSLSADIN